MRKRLFSLVVIIVFFLEICAFPVHASILGLNTYDLPEEEKTVIIQKTNLEVLQEDINKDGIRYFDVNENGSYALAMGTGSNCRVYVYDSNGVFLYGYRFYCDGDYAIGFHEDDIAIYFLRGNTISLYDADGTCTSVQKVSDTDWSYAYISEMLNQTTKNIAGRRYVMERDMEISNSYSRFVSISQSGERTVLYDVSSEHALGQGVFLLAVGGFFLFVIVGVCRKQKSKDNA